MDDRDCMYVLRVFSSTRVDLPEWEVGDYLHTTVPPDGDYTNTPLRLWQPCHRPRSTMSAPTHRRLGGWLSSPSVSRSRLYV